MQKCRDGKGDRVTELFSDDCLLWKDPSFKFLQTIKGGAEVSLESRAKVAFSSKQSAFHRGTS